MSLETFNENQAQSFSDLREGDIVILPQGQFIDINTGLLRFFPNQGFAVFDNTQQEQCLRLYHFDHQTKKLTLSEEFIRPTFSLQLPVFLKAPKWLTSYI